MIPKFPEVDKSKSYVLGGDTLAEIFSQIRQAMPQAGTNIRETSMGENGTRFDADITRITTEVAVTIYGDDYDPGVPAPYDPGGGKSGQVTLPAGASWLESGSTTTVSLATLTFTKGLLTAIG